VAGIDPRRDKALSEDSERYGDTEPAAYVAFTLPPGLLRGLEAEALRSRQPRSAIVAKALRAELQRRAAARRARNRSG
jgi:hypothetical protein